MNAQAMIVNCIAYKDGVQTGRISIDQISDVLDQAGTFVWVGLLDPDEPLMRSIQTEFGLHDLAIEDAIGEHQRPKLEEYGETLFLVLQTAQGNGDEIRFGETNVFVGRRFVVSVRHGPSASYSKVRERCESTPTRLARGPGFVLYAIMDFVVDNYLPIVEALRARFSRLETELFDDHFDRRRLEELYDLKTQLMQIHAAVSPVREVCKELTRLHSDIIPKDSHIYFRDIEDHIRRLDQTVHNIREMATDAMHVNLALVNAVQNEVVKRLAGWGAILAIPTMVFSMYGMNFRVMPELEWPYGYPLVMAVVVFGSVWLYRKLQRANWL